KTRRNPSKSFTFVLHSVNTALIPAPYNESCKQINQRTRKGNLHAMKKTLMIVMTVMLTIVLAACGQNNNGGGNNSPANNAPANNAQNEGQAAGNNTASNNSQAENQTDLSGSILATGSSALQPLVDQASRKFMDLYPKVTIQVQG